jgi:hypothetical protein
MKLQPLSWSSATMERAYSVLVWSPNIMVPKHRREIYKGLLPRVVVFMAGSLALET